MPLPGVSSIVMRREGTLARMDYLLDLLQGLGIAAAIGIRPFLPTLLAGAPWPRATSGWTSTTPISPSWSRPGSCSAIVVAVAVLGVVDRRRGADTSGRDPVVVILLVISLVLGALFAAGSIADALRRLVARPDRRSAGRARSASPPRARCSAASARGWTTRPRARCRSTPRARRCAAAGLSILFPPLAILVVAALAWLLIGGRRRAGEKYAGLRILR